MSLALVATQSIAFTRRQVTTNQVDKKREHRALVKALRWIADNFSFAARSGLIEYSRSTSYGWRTSHGSMRR